MFRKGLSILLVLVMIMATCLMPAYAQVNMQSGSINKLQVPFPQRYGRTVSTDDRFENTDRNSDDSYEEYDGSITENPYGAEKIGEDEVGKENIILLKSGLDPIKSIEAALTGKYGEIAYEHLEYLSETIGARVADSIYGLPVDADDPESEAREYLAEELERLGYTVSIQPFTFTSRNVKYASANVIATKPGISDKTVIVGAHYDSVSPKPIWLNPPEPGELTVTEAVYMYGKGADDNASGVAIMLEVAERIANIETPYTVEFVAFGAEEKGLRGSGFYVSQMTEEDIEKTVAMINLDSCIAGDDMNVYGGQGEKGWVRELALDIAERLELDLETQQGLNPDYPAGTTGLWSDHAPFAGVGIPYAYFEATNWTLGALDGYTQVDYQYGIDGEIWHTGYDNIEYIEDTFPGRIEERLGTFAEVLTNMLVQIREPGQGVIGLSLSDYLLSMTEVEEIEVTADLGYMPELNNLKWTLGGEEFNEWKKYTSGSYSGEPFVEFSEAPKINGSLIKAKIKFELPYGTVNLSPRSIRRLYPALIGYYELEVTDTSKDESVSTIIKYNAYDSYHTYDEIKPAIDEIIENADTDRYIEYKSLGETVDGRDAHFAILAEDEASVDKYLGEMMPLMLEDPQKLQDMLANKTIGEYKVPIWFNNIHPDEAPGIDAIIELFEQFATQDEIIYKSTGSIKDPKTADHDGTNVEDPEQEVEVSIDVEAALDNVIFLFNFTENPDGRYYNTRGNVNGFDINRDNVYQTQVESRMTTGEIAKWKPVSFLDFHGFMPGFCIEPCTTPHDPNFEYDLLIENMLEQAHLMGKAGIANTKYSNYEIPFEDYNGGWDDGVPSYTAVYAMALGALGHTIEMPELNEDSMDALVNAGFASVSYVVGNKDRLYNNQLEYYQRGIEGTDAKEEVDPWLLDAAGEVIGRPRGDNENFFPEYYVIPVDKNMQKNGLEAYKLAEYMLRNGVRVEKSIEEVTAGGVTYPEGSFVIDMHQALRGYANEILYDGYDVSDFAMMYAEIVNVFHDIRGFDRYEIREAGAFDGKTEGVEVVEVPAVGISEEVDCYVISNNSNDAVKAVNQLLKEDKTVRMLTASGKGYSKGDYIVSKDDLAMVAEDYYLEVTEYKDKAQTITLMKPSVAAPSASGQMTFALNELGFDIADSTDEGNVIVTDSYTDVSAEIDAGKPYVGIGPDALYFIKDVLGLEGFDYISSYYEALMRGTVAQDSMITAGYPAEEEIYNAWGAYISSVPEEAQILTRINDDDTYFKAGWWPDTDIYGNVDYGKLQAKGKALAITTLTGEADARVTVFANYLVNKAHPQNDWRMLANAIFTSMTNTISPTIATFDKRSSNQADITITVIGSRLSKIKRGENELSQGMDYTVNGDEVTIKASYMAKLPVGATILNFIFTRGESCALDLTIISSTKDDNDNSGHGSRSSGSSTSTTQTASPNKVILPYEALSVGNIRTHNVIKHQTALGTMELPDNMLTGTGLAKTGDSIGISLETADISGIPEALREQLGGRPVFDINLEVNGVRKLWSNPDAPVTVSVNYTPTGEELMNPDSIVVWYLDEATNTPVPIPNCKYDPATGKVSFAITHFSKYAVAYVMPVLTDIGGFSWAEKQINTVVAKGTLKTAAENKFNPDKNVTRGEFMYGLVRTLGLTAGFDNNFSDVNTKDYYYNELGTAKALGIAQGLGNNKFNPESTITRQDMMVLTARAMILAGKLESTSGIDLKTFSDSSQIATYARDSVGKITAYGIIIGSGNKINPNGLTSRAEAAVILYRISKK